MNSWVYLGVAIVGEVVATSTLKSSEGFSRLVPSAIVIVGYAVAFYCLSLALKTIPVGIAYAIWSGLGIMLIAAIAWFMQSQRIDAWGVVGMASIVCGVAVLNLLSKTTTH